MELLAIILVYMVTQYNHRLPIKWEIEAEEEVRVREKFEDVGFEGESQ